MHLAPLLAEITWQGLRGLSDIVLLAGFAVAFLLVILLYLRDAQRLHPLWTFWLLTLRLAVFAALVIILLNPRDRTRNTEQVPSRVILLVDTSSSMGFREESGSAVADRSSRKAGASDRTRAQAVYDLLRNTPLVTELARHHQLSLFTFDKQLHKQPLLVQGHAAGKNAAEKNADKESTGGKASADKTAGPPDPLSPLLKPEGLETRLGEALQELMRLQKGRSLSAVVVISDGQHNSGIHPAAANIFARNNKIRVYTVGVGSTVPPVNVRVADVQAPNEVNRGSPFDVTVYVQGERLGGKQVQVKLRYKPQGADDKELRDAELREEEEPDADVLVLPNTSRSVPKTFHLKPLPPGKYEYVVQLQPLFQVDEFRKDDNIARHRLNVIERNLGILIIAGGPMRDYRFVRNMLFRHKNIDLDIWLQTVDDQTVGHVSQEADDVLTEFPESFPTRPKAIEEGYLDDPESVHAIQYDVIIAFDPDWNSERFGTEGIRKLERWLSAQAGGLILIAGDVNTPLLATAPENDPVAETVRRFYPVVLSQSIVLDSDTKSDKPWPFQLTEAARGVSFFNLAEEEQGEEKPEAPPPDAGGAPYPWNEFPGFYRCYPSEGKKAGAVVYSFFSDPAMEAVYESKPILFATQDYGVGRVLYFGTSEIWRLRDLDVDYYDRFWVKAVFDAAKRRLGRKSPFGNILLRKDEYFVGDNVYVEVNLLNLNNEPIRAESVRMDVLRPNGKVLDPPLKLLRDPNRPGFYVGNFTAREQGTYQLRVDNPVVPSRNRITAVVPVRFSQTESLHPIQNAELLDRLAEGTGGRYFGFPEFRRLFGTIGTARQKVEELKRQGAAAKEVRQAEAELQKAREPLIRYFPDAGYTLQVNEQVDPLWDSRWVIFVLVGALSVEWLTRKLLKLA